MEIFHKIEQNMYLSQIYGLKIKLFQDLISIQQYQKDKLKGKSNSPILIEAQCVAMPYKSKLSKMEKRKT